MLDPERHWQARARRRARNYIFSKTGKRTVGELTLSELLDYLRRYRNNLTTEIENDGLQQQRRLVPSTISNQT